MKINGFAAFRAGADLEPFSFDPRALRSNDVEIEILYCGVCHSDLHQARNDWSDWGPTTYPVVPGHEIVGRVTAIGSDVTRHRLGDAVAVGCLSDACMTCDQCRKGEEIFCRRGPTATYNGRDRVTGEITYGGYSKQIIVREEFVLSVPDGLDLARAAPLLCAGITTYSPLRTWNVGPGSRVGVVGLGGLGHMAVKIASAMGARVTVISRDDRKRADALALGADDFIVANDEAAMRSNASSFDLIIDTVPVKHDVMPYVGLLDIDATLVLVGQIGPLESITSMPLLFGRRRIAASPIGGIAQTQELLDFCARKNILPDCELIPMQQINQAFERMERSDVRYRFVLDMASLAASGTA